jgi:hypothetical protein
MSAESNDAIELLPHNELVKKMAKDLYLGNGKPALTVRMALQEENMEQVQSDISDIKTGLQKFNILVFATMLSSIGGLIAIVVELVKK